MPSERRLSLPLQVQLSMRSHTISQIEIDQALVRNANFSRDGFKIVNAFLVQTDGDLFFQLRSVRVFYRLGEVVFVAHELTFCRILLPVSLLFWLK